MAVWMAVWMAARLVVEWVGGKVVEMAASMAAVKVD
jgi:hypothetical protein